MRDRLAAETPEERETRLQRMSSNQYERLAVETPEERETRLQQMRDRQAAETPEERELRLKCYSRRYMEQQSVQPQLPLFQHRSIQAKMRKFHANVAGYIGYTNVLHLFRKIFWPPFPLQVE